MSLILWIKDDIKKNWIISNSTLSLCLRSFPLFCGIFISNPILRGKLAVAKFCGHQAAARGFFPILKFYLLSNKSHYVARERLMCSNRANSDLSQTVQHTIRLTCCQTGTRRRVPLKSICNQHWHFVTPHKITLSSQIWGKGWVEIVGGREGGDSLGGRGKPTTLANTNTWKPPLGFAVSTKGNILGGNLSRESFCWREMPFLCYPFNLTQYTEYIRNPLSL